MLTRHNTNSAFDLRIPVLYSGGRFNLEFSILNFFDAER